MHFFPDHKFDYGHNAWRESPKKRRDALKTAILTKKSKIFIKAKLTVSKSCLLGLLRFMILFVLVDAILQKGGYFKNWSGNFLFYFKNHLVTLQSFIFQWSFVSTFFVLIPTFFHTVSSNRSSEEEVEDYNSIWIPYKFQRWHQWSTVRNDWE